MQVNCFVARVCPPLVEPALPIQCAGAAPESFLNGASAGVNGQPALDLRLDYSRVNQVATAPSPGLLALHVALRSLTLNETAAGPVNQVGVLLADRFGPRPTALGLMFDPGFNSGVSDPTFNTVPREGCAIFLDAISALRGAGPAYQQEIGFTTVHEIGHIFNLWHIQTTPNFMAQSPAGNPFGAAAFFFAAAHARFLAAVDASPFVVPGGMSAARAATIADVVDPGYDEFDVWIETPDGRRRRYRSPALYCGNIGKLRIRPGAPFRRDIPIFGESGGYTFTECGRHRVFCTLRVGRTVVQSNVVEMMVKGAEPRSTKYARLRAELTNPRNARLLFYNASTATHRCVEPLLDAARQLQRTPAAANIRYSLGKALVATARGSRPAARRKYMRQPTPCSRRRSIPTS
jgi:hypothetical protein